MGIPKLLITPILWSRSMLYKLHALLFWWNENFVSKTSRWSKSIHRVWSLSEQASKTLFVYCFLMQLNFKIWVQPCFKWIWYELILVFLNIMFYAILINLLLLWHLALFPFYNWYTWCREEIKKFVDALSRMKGPPSTPGERCSFFCIAAGNVTNKKWGVKSCPDTNICNICTYEILFFFYLGTEFRDPKAFDIRKTWSFGQLFPVSNVHK